jgi:DNA-binding transcriptional ArsR family regulator
MGTSKTAVFSEEDNRIAELAKALAHPARIAILRVLVERKACICGDLVEELPLSQATVSQHLKELKRIGLIKGEIHPPRVCYCIDESGWAEARNALGSLLALVEPSCCS